MRNLSTKMTLDREQTCQLNLSQFPMTLKKKLEELRGIFHERGWCSTLCHVGKVLIERGLKYTNLQTGEENPHPDGKSVITTPGELRLFHQTVAINSFETADDLHTAMDASGLMLWSAAPDNSCQHASTALLSFTGRTVDQFLGTGWGDVIYPNDRERTFIACRDAFVKHLPFVLTYRLRRKDGVYQWMSDYAHPRYLLEGTFAGYVGTMSECHGPEAGDLAAFYDQRKFVLASRRSERNGLNSPSNKVVTEYLRAFRLAK